MTKFTQCTIVGNQQEAIDAAIEELQSAYDISSRFVQDHILCALNRLGVELYQPTTHETPEDN